MKHLKSTLSLVLALFVFCVVSASAQSTASLTGVVTDPSGAVVPGAHIKVHSLATGSERMVDSDSAGLFVVPSLVPGDYSVEASANGFSAFLLQKITLQVDQQATVNAKLAVASAGETIQVESIASQIEAQTMTVGQVIDKETVQEIPLNGRHFLDLTVLTAGGVTAPATGSLTAPSRGLGANSFDTAGDREDSVNFQVNGVNLNDMAQNQITFQPSINTTSEVKINNSTYSAEYGRSSGSIVNVSTRSGTSEFHGEVFDYNRNNSFDARNFFNPVGTAQNSLKRNNFGAAFGGPLWRHRTFFFGSYEGLRQHQGLPLVATVLLPADRAAVTDPVDQQLLNYIPVGVANNATSNTANTSENGPVQTDQGTMDILHNLTSIDTLHGFYAVQKDIRTEPNLQGNTVSGFGDHRQAQRQILTINEIHVFNSHIVNEARLGFNRVGIAFIPNFSLNPTTLGFNNYPAGTNPTGGIPQTTISGYSLNIGGPSGFSQGRSDTLGVVSDTLNWTLGKNAIKLGGEFRRFLNAGFSDDTGTLSFSTTPTIKSTTGTILQTGETALWNFQHGQAASWSITPPYAARVYDNSLGGFIVDNYKLTPNFTIEAGLRFEWNGSPTVGDNKAVLFIPSTVSLVRLHTNGYNTPYNQNYTFEPRLGVIYDVFGNGKTVVRAGYGLMADQPETNLISGLTSNTPLSAKVSYVATTATSSSTVVTNTAATSNLATIPVESLYASAAASSIAVSAVQSNYRNAYTETFNFNIQNEVGYGIALSLGYYGSVGRHLRMGSNINEILPTTGARSWTALSSSSPIDPGVSINSNITEQTSNGMSNYNALWFTARKAVSHGVELNFNWQYSKSMDQGSLAGTAYTDILQPQLNYGLSDFDTRHRISANGLYTLPFKGNRLVEGYKLSGIVQWQTGNPLNITTTSTYTGTANVQHPNLLAPIPYTKQYVGSATSPLVDWFANPAGIVCATPATGCVFQAITTGFGNMQRNAARGPGFADTDMSLEKVTKITEKLNFQLRADVFDIFNHASFGNPGTSATVGSSSFGVITATRFPVADLGSSRQIQFSGRFQF